MLALSLVVCLQLDVYLKCDILGVINLPSTASLGFAFNRRRRYLVLMLVQCLLISLHLRKPLKTGPVFDRFSFLLLCHLLILLLADPPLLSSVISFYSAFNLLLFSPRCECQSVSWREGKQGYLLSRGPLVPLVSVPCARVPFSVRV